MHVLVSSPEQNHTPDRTVFRSGRLNQRHWEPTRLLLRCCLFIIFAGGIGLPVASASTPPEITCPSDTVIYSQPADCSGVLLYNVAVSDDQPGWTLTQTAGLPSGAPWPLGLTVNQFTVTDVEGNTATCSFTVTMKDYVPPVAVCQEFVTVAVAAHDPNDCYDSQVAWIPASVFDDGSYDNCSNIKLAVRRSVPFSDCINALNSINGHPDCNDWVADFPTEFERAVMEQDSLKIYCCEAGAPFYAELVVYQLNPDGNLAIGPGGFPIRNICIVEVQVDTVTCTYEQHSIYGRVMVDANKNCVADDPILSAPDLIVRAVNNLGDTLFTTTNGQGNYTFNNLEEGVYSIAVITNSPLWEVCNNPAVVTITTTSTDIQQDFLIKSTLTCPLMYVDLGTALMRPCSTSIWTAQYCNIGSELAEDVWLQILPDTRLTVVGASLPYTLNGDTMAITLGDVPAGDCGSVQISLQVPCDAEIAGENLCVEAHIFPDTICRPPASPWSGAQIEALATCDGDSVLFILRNTGQAPTAGTLDYIVIDDMVIMREAQIPAGFAPGSEQYEWVSADGNSVRIQAQQEQNHPVPLNPSLLVENCNGATTSSLLFAFINEDGNPFTDLECREVVTSFDPNEKLAFPQGYSDEHFIEPNTPLKYQLNFQNTGNDTAFLIVLRDTLSALLDPATLRMGASSHAYTWELTGAGVLSVRFSNILLPDSTTNEPASHGFVRFDIAQKPDNPIGSVIENRAGIYFDINPVVLTNTVFHTVGNNFIPVAAGEPQTKNRLAVYPNPASDRVYLPLSVEKPVRVILRDLYGRPLRSYSGKAPGMFIPRDGLPDGLYQLEIQLAGGQGQAATLIWQGRKW